MIVTAVFAVRRFGVRRTAWTERRLEITHDHIEAMVGHATRLAQQPAAQRHDREDVRYLADRVPLDLSVLMKRYQDEVRRYLGRPDREDLKVQLWIEMIREGRPVE